MIPLVPPNAAIDGTQGGRNWSGQIYVATPKLLKAFGITASQIDPHADFLTSRPGLSSVSGLVMDYASASKAANGPGQGGTPTQHCVGAAALSIR